MDSATATEPRDKSTEIECDILVAGSGAAGLAAAIVARAAGLHVILTEKEAVFGGTTAWSGGWLWIPCNSLARKAGVSDSKDEARTYLRNELGHQYDPAQIDAYIEHGPNMVDFFEGETSVHFFLGANYPDYHPDLPGARDGGRAICAMPFDGRELGELLSAVRPPAREMTLFGLKVGSGPDFNHFFNARRSLRSALYVLARIMRHAADVVIHGRDLILMSGNALIGRLVKSATDRGITLWRNAPLTGLISEDGRVAGGFVSRDGKTMTVRTRRGVVLACGGFAQDYDRRKQLYPHAPGQNEHFSLAGPGDTGDGLRLAETAGGRVDTTLVDAAPYMPVSRVPYPNGSYGLYPHSYERGKPGAILINGSGRRFVNESNSYHDVVSAMIRDAGRSQPVSAHLIADHDFLQRYGLGIVKPFPLPMQPYLRSGYLARANTIADLARSIGVDPAELEATIENFNRHAERGEDPAFKRGTNAYNAYQGDPRHKPNPCLAPIRTPPFYAVRVFPGDLGTFAGIKTDAKGAVLNEHDKPIRGLYAVGNDMASIFKGHYPGPGANLGPAMTFGYLCAKHLAREG